ncbi:MAG TPA: hypothetical protein VFY83_02290, partial [Anaerolineales bacterium]|nr:hypothetical protein [Anaerolineales bacterium]
FAQEANHTRIVPEYPQGYLSQPEMRSFIQTALALGWTLVPYEADHFQWLAARHGMSYSNTTDMREIATQLQPYQAELLSDEFSNWREEQQALNLISALRSLPPGTPLLVWCGNSHHSKRPGSGWVPMGYQFQQHSHINPFVIDQTPTVKFNPSDDFFETELINPFAEEFARYGGTAGLLKEEIPSTLALFDFHELEDDALLFSTQNELE